MMRIGPLELVRLVEEAQDLAEFEEAMTARVRAMPADPRSVIEFLEVPTGDLFDVKPEQAIEYFKSKGLKPSFSYADMMDEAHDSAFTVAKMMDVDMLGQIRASLDLAMANGQTFKEWSDTITPVLQSGGWWGRKKVVDPLSGQEVVAQLGSPWRLETIFRTNMQTAYAAGAWQEINAQKEIAPYLMYDAVDDLRTRPLHASWDQKVLQVTSPWWQTHYPPNGYNSVVPDQRVSGHAILGLKALYSGQVVEVVGASGGRFTVTAQHPVLTRRGWVDAKDLREGDELVAYRSEVGRGAASADQNENQTPPTITEVFDTLALCARASVPRAALHLNGDSFFFESDVDVVGADRELVDRLQSAANEFAAKVDLLHSTKGERLRSSLRALVALAVADVPVSGGNSGNQGHASLIAGSVLDLFGANRIRFDPVGAKVTSDVLATLSQLRPDLAQTHPLFIEAENLLRDWFADVMALAPAQPVADKFRGIRAGSIDARLTDDFVGGFGVNAEAARDIADRQAGSVQFDRVAALTISNYSGHVYDLQTVSGTIALYGGESLPHYVVSNCRCGVIQMSADEVEALGLQAQVDPPNDGTYDWANPRTGEELKIPKGIDPGFTHNAGKSWAMEQKFLLKEKIGVLPPDMQAAAKAARQQAEKLSSDAIEAATQAQAQAAAAQAQAALARAQAMASEKAKQWAAKEQIDLIAKGAKGDVGAGAQFKIKALAEAKKIAGWPELRPVEQLDKVNEIAATLKSKQVQSQGLSTYKKAILEGKNPPPAAVKAFLSMPEDEANAWLTKLEAEKAAIAAKKTAQAAEDAKKAAAGPAMPVKPIVDKGKTWVDDVEAMMLAGDLTELETIKGLVEDFASDTPSGQALKAYVNDAIAFVKAGKNPGAQAAQIAQIGEAPNVAKLTQIGPQKGSNPGGLFQDTDTGAKWYLKWPSDAEMIRNEVLASKLYALGGVDVAELHIVEFNGRKAIASRFVDGLAKGAATDLAAAAGTADGFAFDAWLANWDAVGLSYDNLLLKGGKAYRIDVGGSLRYKATGTLKPGSSFGSTVGELDTMKNAGLNPQAASVFGKISGPEFEKGVARLLAIDETQIRAMVEAYGPSDAKARAALIDTLLKRRADIAKRFASLAPASAEAIAEAVKEAAGAIGYARGLLDEAILTAVKGIAKRASTGAALDSKDIERASAAATRLEELRTASAVLLPQARADLLAYYEPWLADLKAAVEPGAGKPAKWGGSVFKPHSGAIEVDSTKVKPAPVRAPGSITPPGEANKIIAKAFGPSAANLQIPNGAGKASLTARMHDEHQRVIACYTGSYYRELNRSLRTASTSAGQKKVEALLNEALSLAPAYKGTVYRGLDLSGTERAAFIANHKAAVSTGQALAHAQFNSTSRDASSSFGGGIRLVIESKTGVHVKAISLHPSEDEVLFRSDARFRVLEVTDAGGRVTIRMEEV